MLTIEDIYQLIHDECGIKPEKLFPDSDLNGNFGIEGDDFDELMLAFSNKFKVNIDSYLWYFHCGEEGGSLFPSIFPAPNQRVKKIAVTPELLLKYAQSKVWSVEYPKHNVPKQRLDIISNRVFLVLLLIIALIFVMIKS